MKPKTAEQAFPPYLPAVTNALNERIVQLRLPWQEASARVLTRLGAELPLVPISLESEEQGELVRFELPASAVEELTKRLCAILVEEGCDEAVVSLFEWVDEPLAVA